MSVQDSQVNCINCIKTSGSRMCLQTKEGRQTGTGPGEIRSVEESGTVNAEGVWLKIPKQGHGSSCVCCWRKSIHVSVDTLTPLCSFPHLFEAENLQRSKVRSGLFRHEFPLCRAMDVLHPKLCTLTSNTDVSVDPKASTVSVCVCVREK